MDDNNGAESEASESAFQLGNPLSLPVEGNLPPTVDVVVFVVVIVSWSEVSHGGSAPLEGQGCVGGRLDAWSIVLVKVVITWVFGNLSVAIDFGPSGQKSANIWVVKGGVEVLDPQNLTGNLYRNTVPY